MLGEALGVEAKRPMQVRDGEAWLALETERLRLWIDLLGAQRSWDWIGYGEGRSWK